MRRGLGSLQATTGTIVQTIGGGSYEIPGGIPGSYPWVRQASLLANVFHNGGDDARAYQWTREYNKRRLIWDAAQSGADLQEILEASDPDYLAPLRLLVDLVTGAVRIAGEAADAVIASVNWLPVLILGAIGAAAYGFHTGGLRVRR